VSVRASSDDRAETRREDDHRFPIAPSRTQEAKGHHREERRSQISQIPQMKKGRGFGWKPEDAKLGRFACCLHPGTPTSLFGLSSVKSVQSVIAFSCRFCLLFARSRSSKKRRFRTFVVQIPQMRRRRGFRVKPEDTKPGRVASSPHPGILSPRFCLPSVHRPATSSFSRRSFPREGEPQARREGDHRFHRFHR